MQKYIIFILLFSLGGNFSETIARSPIICDSPCNANHSAPSICEVKKIQKVPYPKKSDITANAPNELNGTWNIYTKPNGFKAIAFDITWSQSGNSFFHLVTGFYVSVIRTASSRDHKFRFNFNKALLKKENISGASKVVVNYPCFGKGSEDITPNHVYTISVKALPMYHENDEVQVQEKEIDIFVPGCDNERVSLIEYCQRLFEREKYEDDYDEEDYPDDYVGDDEEGSDVLPKNDEDLVTPFIPYIVAGAFVALLIFLSLALCLVFRKRRYGHYKECNQPKDDGRLLILVNTREEDSLHRDAANITASLFGNKHTCNLWNLTHVTNPESWTEEQLKRSDHVILICTPKGKQHYEKFCSSDEESFIDTFVAGVHKHTGHTIRTLGASAIYFDADRTTCIPNNLSDQIPCFQILENFDKFMKHIGNKILLPHTPLQNDRLRQKVDAIRNRPSECNGFVNTRPDVTIL